MNGKWGRGKKGRTRRNGYSTWQKAARRWVYFWATISGKAGSPAPIATDKEIKSFGGLQTRTKRSEFLDHRSPIQPPQANGGSQKRQANGEKKKTMRHHSFPVEELGWARKEENKKKNLQRSTYMAGILPSTGDMLCFGFINIINLS